MKKTTSANRNSSEQGELCAEYQFDYSKAKPNRFAEQSEEHRVVVVLDPEVAKVFETPDSVNEVLRALIKTMPKSRQTAPRSKQAVA
jgi:hypothetical protein